MKRTGTALKRGAAGLVLLAAACSRRPQPIVVAAEPPARVVYVMVTPTAIASQAAEVVPLTPLPVAAVTLAAMTNEQTFRIAPPATPVPPYVPEESVKPTPSTIREEMARCLTYTASENNLESSTMLPGNVRLKVEARNSCSGSSFVAEDTRFEIRALDGAGHVVAREVGRFYEPIPPFGRVETRIVMKPGEGSYRYDIKPWWAAAGGRRVGE